MTEDKDMILSQILRVVPSRIKSMVLNSVQSDMNSVQEVVFRAGRPVCIIKTTGVYFLCDNGCLTQYSYGQKLTIVTPKEITEMFNIACSFSVYSHINEIKEGYITISGGHRVGISGTAVISEGEIVNIRDVSTISLRFSREVKGCGEVVLKELLNSHSGLLLCGSPCSGKTTVLRDVARLLSVKYNYRVSLVDTRGEIAATYKGCNQKDVGMCDVLDGYPRDKGIEQAIRILSPQYVLCDEVGSESDVSAIVSGLNSGTKFVATMHASDKSELKRKKNAYELISSGAFGKIVFLSGRDNPGVILNSYTGDEIIDVQV